MATLRVDGMVLEEEDIVQKIILPVVPISVLYFQTERFLRVDSSVRERWVLKGGDEFFAE